MKTIHQAYATLAASIADIVEHPHSEPLIVAELVQLADRLDRLAGVDMETRAAAIRRDLVVSLARLTTEDLDYGYHPSPDKLRAMVAES